MVSCFVFTGTPVVKATVVLQVWFEYASTKYTLVCVYTLMGTTLVYWLNYITFTCEKYNINKNRLGK